jgi:hypothetical protein
MDISSYKDDTFLANFLSPFISFFASLILIILFQSSRAINKHEFFVFVINERHKNQEEEKKGEFLSMVLNPSQTNVRQTTCISIRTDLYLKKNFSFR